jgi:hypothetical protein
MGSYASRKDCRYVEIDKLHSAGFGRRRFRFDLVMHVYEVRPRKDHRGVDLISDSLPFGRLWYGEPNAMSNAVDCAKFRGRSYDAVIRVYDEAASVIGTQEHTGDFKEP